MSSFDIQVAGQEVCGHFIVPSEDKFYSRTGQEAWKCLNTRNSRLGDGLLRDWWA